MEGSGGLFRTKKDNCRKKRFYSNCVMLSPQDVILTRCSLKKANWYLKKGLATKMSDSPLVVKLNFEPHTSKLVIDEFCVSEKENLCVVCGDKNLENLTSHHIIPHFFRKHFPEKYKSKMPHDVLLLCKKCHESYEKSMRCSKKNMEELAKWMGYSDEDIKFFYQQIERIKEYNKCIIYAKLLTSTEIPEKRRQEIQRFLLKESDIKELAKQKPSLVPTLEKFIAERVVDCPAFIIKWRTHFVESLNPRFLPQGWSIDSRVETYS